MPRSLATIFLAPIIALLVFSSAAAARAGDVLVLKDGERLPGEAVRIEKNHVVWRFQHGTLLPIPLNMVEQVLYDVPEQPAKGPPAGSTSPASEPAGADSPPPDSEADEETAEKPADDETTSAVFTDDVPPLEIDAVVVDDSNLEESLIEAQPTFVEVCGAYRDAAMTSLSDFTTSASRLEFGGRWLTGNSEQEFLELSAQFNKETEDYTSQLEFGGQYGRSQKVAITNRWYANTTTDFNFPDDKWIAFFTSKNEFDEFENLDYRGTLSSGLGYRFIKEGEKKFIVRVGPGVTYEKYIDPANERTTPDLFTELEYSWPVFNRTLFELKSTLHPSLQNFNVFRTVSNAGVLVKLDEAECWSLKFGVRHEHNSSPNQGRLPDDITMSVLLVYARK